MLKARKMLYEFPKNELAAVTEGFNQIFPSKFKGLLSARELGTLISGESTLNLVDWQSNTSYQRITQVDLIYIIVKLIDIF